MRLTLAPFGILLYMAIAASGRSAPPPSPADETRLVRIQQLIQAGDLRAARSEVQEALKSLPGDPRLYNFLGVLDAQQQSFAAAESNFRRAIDLAPAFTGAYLNLGRLYQERSAREPDLGRALDVYRRLLRFEPGNVEANFQSAWILNHLRNFARSLEHLSRLPADAQGKSAALALRCADLTALGDLRQASAAGRRLLAVADLAEADVLTVLPTLTAHRQSELAASLLEEIVRRGAATPAAFDQLAAIYEGSKRFEPARRTLEKELQLLGRPSPELLLRLARTAYLSSDLEGSLGYLAHARDLQPANPMVHYLFGLVCIDLKLPPEAKQSLQQAARLDSANPFAQYALAAVLLQQKDTEGALLHFQKFHELRPLDPRGAFALGVAYFDAYRLDAARRELTAAAEHPQTRSGAQLYLGRLAVREGHLQDAAEHLRLSIQANPSEPDAYAELGLVQIRLKEYEHASQALAQALRIAPDHYRANLNLLMLYQRTNDARGPDQSKRVEQLRKAGEEREIMLLRTLDIRPY